MAAILSSPVWVVLAGHREEARGRKGGRGRQATTVQRCHSPLHRSLLSQLTACNLGVKAAFSLRRQGERASVPSALTKGFSGRQPLVVSEACSEPRPGLDEPSMTCDTSSAGAQLEEKQLVREGSAVSK